MPNHVINEVIFRGVDASMQSRVLTMVRNAGLKIDFGILVPVPHNIWLGSVGMHHEKAFGKENTALDWCRRNWGTKWNAYGEHEIDQTDDTLTLRFRTAWGPPYGWLVAAFNFMRLDFDHNWYSEGGEMACAKWNFKALESDDHGADPWIESEPDEPMKRHLHKLLWGVEEFTDEDAA